ncbi:amino acid kinase [Aurantimonas sp. A2-1-M11]
MDNILVVKFGGSYATTPDLLRWLKAIEDSSLPVVIVPGGGPFAEAVRRYQPRIGFNDATAHEMAMLAMEQFGLALVGLGSRLVRASDDAGITAALARGDIPVWMPRPMALAAPEIAQDWSVTSDSLAAWLAGHIPGARLCLIKQIDLPDDSTLAALAGAEIVDEAFAKVLSEATELFVAGPADLPAAGIMLSEGTPPGRRIGRAPSPAPDAAASG